MAAETCALTVTDFTGNRQGGPADFITLQAVSMDLTVFEVKELICGEKKDPNLTAANTLLYMGKVLLEDKKQLKLYNRSRRTHLSLELQDLKHINVTKMFLKVPSHETVGYLRQEIANELGDPVGHPARKLRLSFRGNLLENDLEDLSAAGLTDNSSVAAFVRLCFFRKKTGDRGQTTDGGDSSKSPAVSRSSHDAAVGGEKVIGEGNAEAAGAVQAPPPAHESRPEAVTAAAGAGDAPVATGEGAESHAADAAGAMAEPAQTVQDAMHETEAVAKWAEGAPSPSP